MRLSQAMSPAWNLGYLWVWALRPFASAIFARPSLLLRPKSFKELWLSILWKPLGEGIDERQSTRKRALITPNAVGVVLDIGSGAR